MVRLAVGKRGEHRAATDEKALREWVANPRFEVTRITQSSFQAVKFPAQQFVRHDNNQHRINNLRAKRSLLLWCSASPQSVIAITPRNDGSPHNHILRS